MHFRYSQILFFFVVNIIDSAYQLSVAPINSFDAGYLIASFATFILFLSNFVAWSMKSM